MSEQSAELELTSPAPAPRRKPRSHWLLVSNQLNLMFMLAAGLVTGPRGFGRKYYADPLLAAPGWIPLFAERIPAEALDQAAAEETYLEALAASVDLRALRGEVQAVDSQGRMHALDWPDEADGDEQILLVPAPLPATWLDAILFPSKEVCAKVREQASDYANVPLAAYRQLIKVGLFRNRGGPAWPPDVSALPPCDHALHRVLSVGALHGLLAGLGNRGDALVRASALLADSGEGKGTEDPLLRAVLFWAAGAEPDAGAEIQSRLLTQILKAVVAAKVAADDMVAAGEPWCPPDTHQAVLAALETERRGLSEPKWQEALARLIQDLEGLLGLGDATVSELLGRHARPLSRGLILFFLRPRCGDLLTLAQELTQLSEQDLLVAAALFAARGSWMELPQSVRDIPGLAAATGHRMAAMAHRLQHSGLELGPAPPRVRPLRELLSAGDADWSKQQREAALTLVREMGWQALLRTRISLGKGDYRLQVDGRGLHLVLDGDVKAVRTEVDPARLLRQLVSVEVPTKLEARVRDMLQP